MTPPVIIIGAGGLGREVLASLRASGETVAGFLVERGYSAPDAVAGLPVRSSASAWAEARRHRLVLAVGDGRARQRLAAQMPDTCFVAVRHPAAVLGSEIQFGDGAMLIGLASVTVDISIGEHALINPGCAIAHDCCIGAFANLAPGVILAGHVVVEEGAALGVGVVVKPNCRIGAWSVVGAGAVVISDVPAGARVVGVPARPI